MTDVQPRPGMVFRSHNAVAKNLPNQYRVTAVREGRVYFRRHDVESYRPSQYVALDRWSMVVNEVVSLPEPKASQIGPRLTATQARALHKRAHEAGLAAGKAARPAPMHVVERQNPLDDTSVIVREWETVTDGVCGFAWVVIRPANGSFARWLKKQGLGRTSSYEGGYHLSVDAFGQSYERKSAYAGAYAAVLREAGIRAYVDARMD